MKRLRGALAALPGPAAAAPLPPSVVAAAAPVRAPRPEFGFEPLHSELVAGGRGADVRGVTVVYAAQAPGESRGRVVRLNARQPQAQQKLWLPHDSGAVRDVRCVAPGLGFIEVLGFEREDLGLAENPRGAWKNPGHCDLISSPDPTL